MNAPTGARGDARVLPFFLLSLFAWTIWVPQAVHRFGLLGWAPSLESPLNALTVWSPALAALVCVLRASGKAGVADLVRGLRRWRVPLRWYLVALLLEPARWFLALGIDRLLGRDYELGPALLEKTFTAGTAYMIPVAIVFTLPNALGEEIGWRAFALPRLQARHGGLLASVIIGLFWGFWHLPALIAWATSGLAWLPLLLMVVNTVPSAIVFTWIFNHTGASLLLVCLYHAAIANTGYLLPDLPTATGVILLWLIAIAIVAGRGLAPREAATAARSPGRRAIPAGSRSPAAPRGSGASR